MCSLMLPRNSTYHMNRVSNSETVSVEFTKNSLTWDRSTAMVIMEDRTSYNHRIHGGRGPQ